MKLAFVVGFLSRTGGLDRSIQVLARHLIAQGHEVDILYWDRARGFDDGEVTAGKPCRVDIFGLSRHSLASNVFRKLTKTVFGRFRHMFFFFYAYLISPTLHRFLLRRSYDHVFIQDQHYIPVHRLQLPHTVVIHGNWQHAYLRHRLQVLNRMKKGVYSRLLANKNIYTVSQGVRENLIHYFAVGAENVVCTYNPIDFQHLSKLAAKEPELTLSEPYWLASGRLHRGKRFDRLIKAFAISQVPGDLVIMGKGHLQPWLEELAEQHEVRERVHFIGFQPNPMPYYRHARCVIVSSDYEGLPFVLIESLACGTPVISTNCPSGPGEILRLVGLDSWLVFEPQDWNRPWRPEREDEIVKKLAEKIRLFDQRPPWFDPQGLCCFDVAQISRYYSRPFAQAGR